MKVSGFTFIRNAIKYDYPILESINSILPLCDEFVVAVGKSDDETRKLIEDINSPKIKIIDTIWDDSLREGGRVLAQETDKAFKEISKDSDWAFYIQGDEVIHEKYYNEILSGMKKWKDDKKVDGLLFKYLHFYGSYDYVGASTRWYRNEIRIVRKNENIFSYRDAQGFRKGQNNKLNVKQLDAYVYHYGWVKKPDAMQRKQESFHKMWHDDSWLKENVVAANEFDYSGIDLLTKFDGTHPKVMQSRIDSQNWKFDFDLSINRLSFKEKFKNIVEKLIGYRIGEYKNYIKL